MDELTRLMYIHRCLVVIAIEGAIMTILAVMRFFR